MGEEGVRTASPDGGATSSLMNSKSTGSSAVSAAGQLMHHHHHHQSHHHLQHAPGPLHHHHVHHHHHSLTDDIIVGDSHVTQDSDTVLLLSKSPTSGPLSGLGGMSSGSSSAAGAAAALAIPPPPPQSIQLQPGSSLSLDLNAAIAAGKQAISLVPPAPLADGLPELAHVHHRRLSVDGDRNTDDEDDDPEEQGFGRVTEDSPLPNGNNGLPSLPSSLSFPAFPNQPNLLWAGQNPNWPPRSAQFAAGYPSPYLFQDPRDSFLHWNPNSYSSARSLAQALTKSPTASNENLLLSEKSSSSTSLSSAVSPAPGKTHSSSAERKSINIPIQEPPVPGPNVPMNYAHAAQIISPELSLEYLGLYSHHHTHEDISKAGMTREHAEFIRMWRDVKTLQHYYDCACGRRKPLRSVKAILQHTMKHMETTKKSYKCPKCDRVFAHYLGLNSHQRTHKPDGDDMQGHLL
eukprot:TRINITY_DN6686_c0_g2_i1.p1 TRINITY_DN6686_c0_g2~~TRINITY_DN6686_c0_g2_i1.p1  ORF type:complete len:461 (+),score=84.25 TRINITY_DN6686_c0_g2_i1:322-1704(+)